MKSCLVVSLLLALMLVKADLQIKDHCSNKEQYVVDYGQKSFEDVINFKDGKTVRDTSNGHYTVIIFQDIFKSKALIHRVVKPRSSKVQKTLKEIYNLKKFKELEISPVYYDCLYHENSFYIIQEEVENTMSIDIMQKLSALTPAKRILKYIQIAVLIQKLHTKKYVHQNIKLENVVSIDKEMTDFRLLDFSNSVEVGKPGKEILIENPKDGKKEAKEISEEEKEFEETIKYYTVGKLDEKYVAAFHHDAYAFAIMIIILEDFRNYLGKTEGFKLAKNKEEINDQYIANLVSIMDKISKESPFTGFFDYLKTKFEQQESDFDITEIINKLYEIYTNVSKNNLKRDTEVYFKIVNIMSQADKNAETINLNKSSNLV